MLDSHNRNIDYIRISLTEKCNLRCIYCMPKSRNSCSTLKEEMTTDEIIQVVKAAASLGIRKVRYTGGEPLVYRNLSKLIYETTRIPNIKDVSITTNGMLLNDMLEELIEAGLKRVNISLDTLDREKFKTITRNGSLQQVMEGMHRCIALGLKPVKINTVLMKGINDNEISNFIRLTMQLPIDVRFIELMPIGEGIKFYNRCKLSFKEVLEQNPELIPLKNVNQGTALMYKLPNSKGRVGFINPLSCKFCSSCNKIRLTSEGTIKPCLHSEGEIDIKEYIHNEKKLVEQLSSIIINKPLEHHLEEEKISRSKKMMYQLGG